MIRLSWPNIVLLLSMPTESWPKKFTVQFMQTAKSKTEVNKKLFAAVSWAALFVLLIPTFLSDSVQSALKLRIYFWTPYFLVLLCAASQWELLSIGKLSVSATFIKAHVLFPTFGFLLFCKTISGKEISTPPWLSSVNYQI